jgi:hypothetical protein
MLPGPRALGDELAAFSNAVSGRDYFSKDGGCVPLVLRRRNGLVLEAVDCFRSRDNEITRIKAHYDPRAILAALSRAE